MRISKNIWCDTKKYISFLKLVEKDVVWMEAGPSSSQDRKRKQNLIGTAMSSRVCVKGIIGGNSRC